MKPRPDGFLASEFAGDTPTEIGDYIAELHEYLWRFIYCAIPGASGNIRNYIDPAITKLEKKRKATR